VDNVTHSLTGLAMARAGLSAKTRGATLALVVASNLPDIDIVLSLQGSTAYLEHHRGFTHSVLGAPLLALALTLLLRLTLRGSRFGWLLVCSMTGIAGHVLMDLWTSYGTRVLSPFDNRFLTWDLVFIVDPWLLAMLLFAVLWRRRSLQSPWIATAALGVLVSYVGARAVLHQQAVDQAVAQLGSRAVERIAALPSPIDPFSWRILADSDGAYWVGNVNLRKGSPALTRRPKRAEDATVARVREESGVAAVFLAFSTFPWLEVQETEAGTEVSWRDLRFERPGRESFVARVVLGPNGRIVSERFRF